MRLGLLARSENRGLGLMSKDAYTHLRPTRTLVVDVGGPHAHHPEWFPDAPLVTANSPDFEPAAKEMLDNIDTLLILETPYDPRVYEWARERDVRTVCVAMPEYDIPERWGADLVVNPSNYLHDRLPEGSIVLPWPIDISAIAYRPRTKVNRWLHIVGQPCDHDRNGTRLVIEAFRELPHRELLVRAQVDVPILRRLPPNIEVVMEETTTVSELYQDGDALIMPRRYAGQCLVMREAQAAGLPLVCLDRFPERDWTFFKARIPTISLSQLFRRSSQSDVHEKPRSMAKSALEVCDAMVEDVMTVIERISNQPLLVRRLSHFSRQQAEALSWERLGDTWRELLNAPVPVR